MSSIGPIDEMREYVPDMPEDKLNKVEPVMDRDGEVTQLSQVRAAEEQANQKTSVQGFQYTGKGSFIDKVF